MGTSSQEGFRVKRSYLVRLEESAEHWGCKITDKLDFNDHHTKYNMYRVGFYAFVFLVIFFLLVGLV